jgi:HD-like signal output (HDOD) protein
LPVQSQRPGVAILSRIVAQLQRGEIQIPAVPAVATELHELIARSDTRIDALVAVLERDPALVARVLQLGRSASFGRSAQAIPDLHFIINRVGFRQLDSVVDTVLANDCFKIGDLRYQPLVARLIRQSVARAISMRALAERARLEVFPAYLAGLFADVGASFLLWAIVDKSHEKVPDPADAVAYVRAHHETMSGAVLKRWGHAELVANLVRRHHTPLLTGPLATYGAQLIVASQMANELTGETDLTVEGSFPAQDLLARCSTALHLSDAARMELVGQLREQYAAAFTPFVEQKPEGVQIIEIT